MVSFILIFYSCIPFMLLNMSIYRIFKYMTLLSLVSCNIQLIYNNIIIFYYKL